MIKRNLHLVLILLLLADISYSFMQHFHMNLEGDMADGILQRSVHKTLQDPLGIKVLLHDEEYANPNRFFSTWFMSKYFRSLPFIFQKWFSPIDSIYISCAFIKTLLQACIIFLISSFVAGVRPWFKKEMLVVALLITPLFQTYGYVGCMGIIDPSITYNFFYALPLAGLLLFFLPFYNALEKNKDFKFVACTKIALFLMAIILPLSGPLIPSVVLIVCPLIILKEGLSYYKETNMTSFIQRWFISFNKIPKQLLFYFFFISIVSLYSLFIGMNNSINPTAALPLMQRYLRIPEGILGPLTLKWGLPVLLFMIALNAFIIKKFHYTLEGKMILQKLKWIGIFAGIYILLLPLGGYRMYRPNIIRYDTVMPITICFMFIYALSTLFIIKNIHPKYKKVYLFGICVFLFIFINADEPNFNWNACERDALEKIAHSPEKIVLLENDCTVMAWERINDYHRTELNAELLNYWGVTNEKKLYYQK